MRAVNKPESAKSDESTYSLGGNLGWALIGATLILTTHGKPGYEKFVKHAAGKRLAGMTYP